MSAARASAIACDPPSATTHPLRVPGDDQHQPDRAASSDGRGDRSRVRRCRTRVPGRLGAPQPRARAAAGSTAVAPKRANVDRMSRDAQHRLRSVGEQVVEPRDHRREQPTPAPAVASEAVRGAVDRSVQNAGRSVVQRMGTVDRRLQPASRPSEARSSSARNGDAAAIGWTAEQWSCTRPGTIICELRVPPPIVSLASSTVTSSPARASRAAAASPFGPPPTTIAEVTPSRLHTP